MSGIRRYEPSSQVTAALKEIAERHGGILQAEDVVREAKNKSSPLHSRFDWDDTVAGEKWRFWQARAMISVAVDVIKAKDSLKVTKAFVSLSIDRSNQGGYRVMTDVLESDPLREQLIEDSLQHMHNFREKFANLQELGAVFGEMRLAEQKLAKSKALKPETVHVDLK